MKVFIIFVKEMFKKVIFAFLKIICVNVLIRWPLEKTRAGKIGWETGALNTPK